MSDSRGPLAAFDGETVDAVADATGGRISADDLRALVTRHQETVRGLPGVDDIVYEWRNQFHRDPLVHREPHVYVLAVPAHVWDEFAAALDADESEREALLAVHDRQARAIAGGADAARLDEDAGVVLTRP